MERADNGRAATRHGRRAHHDHVQHSRQAQDHRLCRHFVAAGQDRADFVLVALFRRRQQGN